MLSIFNYSVEKLSNLESSFSIIDTSWKNKTPIILTNTFRMVIYLSKTFLQTQSFFIVWNEKQMIFAFLGIGFYAGYKSYIKLNISSVTPCHLSPFHPLIPIDWHQEEPLGYSVFGEPNRLFTQHIHPEIVTCPTL